MNTEASPKHFQIGMPLIIGVHSSCHISTCSVTCIHSSHTSQMRWNEDTIQSAFCWLQHIEDTALELSSRSKGQNVEVYTVYLSISIPWVLCAVSVFLQRACTSLPLQWLLQGSPADGGEGDGSWQRWMASEEEEIISAQWRVKPPRSTAAPATACWLICIADCID